VCVCVCVCVYVLEVNTRLSKFEISNANETKNIFWKKRVSPTHQSGPQSALSPPCNTGRLQRKASKPKVRRVRGVTWIASCNNHPGRIDTGIQSCNTWCANQSSEQFESSHRVSERCNLWRDDLILKLLRNR
jgi:hypothetical protein